MEFEWSKHWYEHAKVLTPGASQTNSKAPGTTGRPLEDFPLVLSHGHGPYVWDVDGNRYIDMICGLATNTLGYGDDGIASAVMGALTMGPSLSLPTKLESDVSERFCGDIGCEQVRWVKTGSEAVSAAVKLARAKTHRSTVLVAEHAYHGWHDWFQAYNAVREYQNTRSQWAFAQTEAWDNGVPTLDSFHIVPFVHNELESVRDQVDHVGDGIAAIILEPHRVHQTQPEFVQGLREIADREGCALIFDDMVWGFRWRRGGAREYFGVEPDLQCFGKALGNGVPIACVCGKETYMERAFPLITSTYGGDRIGLSAARAVLERYERDPIIEKLWDIGSEIMAGFQHWGFEGVKVHGFPVHPRVEFDDPTMGTRFVGEMAKRGVLVHDANLNINVAMGPIEADIISAFKGSCAALGLQQHEVTTGG